MHAYAPFWWLCVCVHAYICFSDYCSKNNSKKGNITGAQTLRIKRANMQLKDFLMHGVSKWSSDSFQQACHFLEWRSFLCCQIHLDIFCARKFRIEFTFLQD